MKQFFKEKLITLIMQHGPIPMDQFMAYASYSYYNNCANISNDFITAPEVSQMFGEIVGIWALNSYLQSDSKKPIILVELGPGNGVMMADILRNSLLRKNVQNVFLYEMSEKMVLVQKKNLYEYTGLIKWFNNIEDIYINILNDAYIIFIANEFFDALPIKQYYISESKVKEFQVDFRNNDLCISLSEKYENLEFNCKDGIIETSSYWDSYSNFILKVIKDFSGCAAIVDYGYIKNEYKSTIQSMKEHKLYPILEYPGESDITALVNFDYIHKIFINNGMQTKIETQTEFLSRFGINERAKILKNNGAINIDWQLDFLMNKMQNFKVLTINCM